VNRRLCWYYFKTAVSSIILRENGYLYVDKTAFISQWWNSGDAVTLIMRPRRFGKTLNMSMLDYFFSNKHEGRGDLFEGLDIWKEAFEFPIIIVVNRLFKRKKLYGILQSEWDMKECL